MDESAHPPPLSPPRTFLFNHVTDRNKKRILRQIWTMSLVLAPYCFERDSFQRTYAESLEWKCVRTTQQPLHTPTSRNNSRDMQQHSFNESF
jgi:hypothetical protein